MDIFIIKTVLAFGVGAIWITLATVIAEKFGTKLGGIAVSIPSTTLLALFFIGWTQDIETALQATEITPTMLVIVTSAVLMYIYTAKINWYVGVFTALLIWAGLSMGAVVLKPTFAHGIILCIIVLPFTYYLLEKRWKIKNENKKPIKYTIFQLLFRAFLSGGIIASAIVITKIGGPIIGGIFACFPATFLSTIIITQRSHGKEFTFAIMKSAVLSVIPIIAGYVIVVRATYLEFGLITGTIFSFIASLVVSYLFYRFAEKNIT